MNFSTYSLFKKHLEPLFQGKGKIPSCAWNHFLRREDCSFAQALQKDFFLQKFAFSPSEDLPSPAEVEKATYAECRGSVLVFVNGVFKQQLSDTTLLPEGVRLLPLAQAFSTFSHFFQDPLQEKANTFALLNTALHREGLFLYFPPHCQAQNPLQVIHFIRGSGKPLVVLPKIHCFMGEGSCLHLYSSQNIQGENVWINGSVDFSLEEGAHVFYAGTYPGSRQMWSFETMSATLKKNSVFKGTVFSEGSCSSCQDYRLFLKGENCRADLSGLSSLKESKRLYIDVLMDHQAPSSTSSQLFKGILEEKSRSHFMGKIYVHREAQQTQAYQLNRHLLLDAHSLAKSQPNLEIFADDVKASHGATIGRVNQEHLHYFRTRGISPEEGSLLLKKGFSQEIIALFPSPIKCLMEQYFKEHNHVGNTC